MRWQKRKNKLYLTFSGLAKCRYSKLKILALTVLRHFAKPVLWDSSIFFVGWLKQIIKMKQDKEYRVVMHKFIGSSETGLATYEITFNKSLEHTGRFSGIEDGLNAYCKKERRTDITDNFKRLWYSLVRWVKN